MKRIIDHKQVDLSDDEWRLYQEICKSYDKPTAPGKQLFSDLFEVDDNGIIIFIKPPRSKFTTMEIWLFIMSIFCHQHIREMYKIGDSISVQLKKKMDLLDEKIRTIDEKLQTLSDNKTNL